MSYEQRLELGSLGTVLTTAKKTKSLRGDLIETYKILTGKEKINSDELFQKTTTTELRGHSLKRYKKSFRLELRKHFFQPKNCRSLE